MARAALRRAQACAAGSAQSPRAPFGYFVVRAIRALAVRVSMCARGWPRSSPGPETLGDVACPSSFLVTASHFLALRAPPWLVRMHLPPAAPGHVVRFPLRARRCRSGHSSRGRGPRGRCGCWRRRRSLRRRCSRGGRRSQTGCLRCDRLGNEGHDTCHLLAHLLQLPHDSLC